MYVLLALSRFLPSLSNTVPQPPSYSGAKFRQQELWAWKPVWSPRVIIVMYLVVSLIFIPIGAIIYVQSTRLLSTPRLRYDDVERCNVGPTSNSSFVRTCTISLEIKEDVEGPVYFYYGLVNFYQNARTYVTSRSDAQLRGDENPDISTCDPLENNPDGSPLVPCGLVANSRFNDTFELCNDKFCNSKVALKGTGIAWNIDREVRFRPPPNSSDDIKRLFRNEDFMVWMRLSAYRNWKKLYRIIDNGLQQGEYFVRINASYPVESFDGEKFFYIAETTWFGGPNEALGLSYLVTGGVALIFAALIAWRAVTTRELDLPPETALSLEGLVADADLPPRDPHLA